MPTEAEISTIQLGAFARHRALTILRSDREACWLVFAGDRAQILGRIPDSMKLREACAALAGMSEEMGALYALADEAGFAKPRGEV